MDTLITKHREGFGPGYTPITSAGEAGDDDRHLDGRAAAAAGEIARQRRWRSETASC